MAGKSLLEVKNLHVNIEDKEILHGVNLTIGEDETHVLMGPNGTGKSTLGYAVTGNPRYSISEGQIIFNGEDITNMPVNERAKKGIFLSFQNPLEVPGVTLSAFIRSALEQKTGKRVRLWDYKKKLAQTMELLSMDESYAERDLNVGFSGGEKKKAEILQMLMLEPSLAILDETDSGLDVDAVRTVSKGISIYKEQCRGSLLIITHSTRILESLHVDVTHVMEEGKIAREGDASLVDEINENGFEDIKAYRIYSWGFCPALSDLIIADYYNTLDWSIGMKEKSHVDDIDRSVYDIRDKEHDAYRIEAGLTPEIVDKISKEKNDPEWMHEFRLKSLEIYNGMKIPDWGPSIEGLDMEHIATYVRPNTKMQGDWKDVPQDIKDTFERLGIPQAERKSLAGVGAQYDSELVYHNVKDEVAAQGVIYTDMESALKGEYADMVHEYFMKLVTPRDHKFAALHGAVWSGGSFVYVPKGVDVSIPLQSYFRLNAKGAGQFEHTLIIVDEGASLHFIEGCSAPKYNVANLHAGCVELFVKKDAKLRYSTIENWSKNMYNLNTKRALVEEGGTIEWVSGSFGSHVSYLYPMSILKGRGSKMEFTGVTFAGEGQNLDTGAKVIHAAPDTSSYMNTRSISKSGGISTFRSSVVVQKNASNAKSAVSCQSLMLDSESRSDTIPAMDIRTKDAAVGHEAKIGSISDDAVFYLMSRGMSEEDARALIVSGFADNVSKELPLEYAVEMNNLIRLEMKGSIG